MGQRLETYDGNGNLVSVIDTRDISEVVEYKQSLITDHRNNVILENGTVWFNGYEYDCDAASRTNLSTLATFLTMGQTLPDGFVWRNHHNIDIPQNAQSMSMMFLLTCAYIESIYTTSWYLKQQVAALAAQDLPKEDVLAQIDAFDPENGWPNNDLTPDVPHQS